jgi:hypothetical protein
MSSSEEEQLTLFQLCNVLYEQNEARAKHGMKPRIYEIPFFFPAKCFEEIKTTLQTHQIAYEDFSDEGDRECSFVLEVKADQLPQLISLNSDGKEVYFQSPDLLLPAKQ